MQDNSPLLGPHKGIEMQLMVSGEKHCAMIDTLYTSEWRTSAKTICIKENFLFTPLKTAHGNYTEMLIWRRGHEWRANQIIKTYERVAKKGFMSELDHSKLGIALGYSKKAIRYFLEKGRKDEHFAHIKTERQAPTLVEKTYRGTREQVLLLRKEFQPTS